DVRFERMLALPADAERLVQTAITDEGNGRAAVTISSRAAGEKEWSRHAAAALRVVAGAGGPAEPLSAIQGRCPTVVEASAHYEQMEGFGLRYGARFQGVARLWMGEGEALARVRLPEDLSAGAGAYGIHPALLDACIQVTVALLAQGSEAVPCVPVG